MPKHGISIVPNFSEKIQLFKEEMKPENWASLQNRDGIEIFRYTGKEEGSGVKAIAEFEATPKQMMDYIAIPGVIEKAGTMIETLGMSFVKLRNRGVR